MKIANIAIVIFGVCAAVACLVTSSVMTPQYLESFSDTGVALPAITRFFIQSSEGGLQFVCGLLAFLLIVKESVIKSLKKKLLLSALGSIVALAALLGYYWAMKLPEL